MLNCCNGTLSKNSFAILLMLGNCLAAEQWLLLFINNNIQFDELIVAQHSHIESIRMMRFYFNLHNYNNFNRQSEQRSRSWWGRKQVIIYKQRNTTSSAFSFFFYWKSISDYRQIWIHDFYSSQLSNNVQQTESTNGCSSFHFVRTRWNAFRLSSFVLECDAVKMCIVLRN